METAGLSLHNSSNSAKVFLSHVIKHVFWTNQIMCHPEKGLDPESMDPASSLMWGTVQGLDDVGGGWVVLQSQKHL